jgi:biopolymer transport protein ExbD
MRRSRRRKRRKIIIPTTSMGDIAFLLIIFFVLCSTKKLGIDLTRPDALGLEDLPKSTILVAIDSEARYWLDGGEMSGPAEIEAAVARRLERVDPNAPIEKRTVFFECDREIPKEIFEPVLEAIAKAGAIIAAVGTETKGQAR